MKKDEIMNIIGKQFLTSYTGYLDTDDDALTERFLGEAKMCAIILRDLLGWTMKQAEEYLLHNWSKTID